MILRWGLSNAASAVLLALGAAAVGVFARRRPALRHGLWVLVLLKLVTPPLFGVPVARVAGPAMAAAVADAGVAIAPERVPAPPDDGPPDRAEEVPEPVFLFEDGPTEVADAVDVRDEPAEIVGAAAAPAGRPWKHWLLSAWAVGTLLTFGVSAVRIARFGRLLRLSEPASDALQSEVDALADRLGLGRAPGVWQVPGEVSPMLWALGCQPRLIVPTELWKRLDDRQRATLLTHELAHLKRRDHWVRGLELLVTGLYWWLPVVWIARHALREAEEQCCDAWVVWAFPDAARTYAEALLETLDFLSGADPAVVVAASGLGPVHHLKRRLTMILKGTTPRALTRSGLLAMLGLSAVLLPLSPTWAQQPPDPEVVFFDALKKDHEFNDPRWPFLIKVKDVQDKTLIDAMIKHRASDSGDPNTFDMVVQAKKAVVDFDHDQGVARVRLDGAEVIDTGEDISLIDNQILEIPIPVGGDAVYVVVDDEEEAADVPEGDRERPDAKRSKAETRPEQNVYFKARERMLGERDKTLQVNDLALRAKLKQLAAKQDPESSRELREAIEELQAKVKEIKARKPGEPFDERAREELERGAQQLKQALRGLQQTPKSEGSETKRDEGEADKDKQRAVVEKLKAEVESRRAALGEAEMRLAKAIKELAQAEKPAVPLARGTSIMKKRKAPPYTYPIMRSVPRPVIEKIVPRPDQEKRIAELEERLEKLQEEVKTLKKDAPAKP